MARNFKLYGCAHDASGSVNVALSIGGTEVFNGAVTARTDAHAEGEEYEVDELLSFDLADDVSGDTAWSVTVTGSEDSASLAIGPLKANNYRTNMTVPLEYFMDKIIANSYDLTVPFTAEEQVYIDTQLGDALPAGVRTKLQAGTSVPFDDGTAVMLANELDGVDSAVYGDVTVVYSNGQIDGSAYDVTVADMWPTFTDGQTLTMTANLTLPVFAYDPPLSE